MDQMMDSIEHQSAISPIVDVVIIGRNEAKRLPNTFRSIGPRARKLIYVDSGSTDKSIEIAKSFNAEVINLDTSIPFTAARARNAGLTEIKNDEKSPDYVQFMDGDCSLSSEWLRRGVEYLEKSPTFGAVCGRRREKFPDASIYNKMCDWEWNTPIGRTNACGGDFLVRYCAITSVDGYREDVIAAEDDELCQRLIHKGWHLYRLDAEMTSHDADMHKFSQWWKRAVRAGHGFAQVGDIHPGYFRPQRRRVMIWGGGVPLLALILTITWTPLLVGIALLYLASYSRCLWRFRDSHFSRQQTTKLAALLVLSKLPNLQGMLTWKISRLRQSRPTIIEYK